MPLNISLQQGTTKGIHAGSWLCYVHLSSKFKHSFLEESGAPETWEVKETHIQGSGSDKVYKAQQSPESYKV